MLYLQNRPSVTLSTLLTLLSSLIVTATYLYIQDKLSATWVLLIVCIIILITAIFSLFSQQQKQLTSVIRALANGDSTLELCSTHAMREQYEQVKIQIQSAYFNAQQQTQFLQALLVHIDLAVLVCNTHGEVIESNPALVKLLGKPIKNLSQLDSIGELILATDKHLKSTAHWQRGEQQDTLSIQISVAEIQGQLRKVVTLQSIHNVLLSQEQQAYKRLTRVLTHEVANSITPLASIAQTCIGLLPDELSFADEEDKQDLSLALNTLSSRAQYLGEFIERFRTMSTLPAPSLAVHNPKNVLEHILALHAEKLEKLNINYSLQVNTTHLLMIDRGQIEQVLINLIKNAIEAIVMLRSTASKNTGGKLTLPDTITLTLGQNDAQQTFIEIADSGAGVSEHASDMIFVPFFTTKQQGSGIGLSLSRQIIINHGGDLIYIKRPNGGCFRCIFG